MIEVFKTNVENPNEASWLAAQISRIFAGYVVNFDLQDCDKIMRVRYDQGQIDIGNLITFLNNSGFKAEVLEDGISA